MVINVHGLQRFSLLAVFFLIFIGTAIYLINQTQKNYKKSNNCLKKARLSRLDEAITSIQGKIPFRIFLLLLHFSEWDNLHGKCAGLQWIHG